MWDVGAAYREWIQLSERELQTESCCLHCQVGKDHVIQSSFEQGNSGFFPHLTEPPEKNSRWVPPPSLWWYFDFSFIFPVYHSLIRSPHAVTYSIQLHLLKRPEMLLSIWNIVQTDAALPARENINVYCSEIKPLPQVPATICLLWGKKSPTGITNPLLVCSAATIQQNKIIPVTAYNLGPQMKW